MNNVNQQLGTGFVNNLQIRWEKTTLSMCAYSHLFRTIIATHFEKDLPLEYNTWLLFRQAVDIILVK